MGAPPTSETSRSRGREDAIETLIDMDPNGAAYRVAMTMNGARTCALQGRSNRIPDGALFDAAHALGRYEITLDSPEILDLYGSQESRDEGGNNGDDRADGLSFASKEEAKDAEPANSAGEENTGDVQKKKKQPTTLNKEGWQTRILRHHDKIIRAKNHANPTIMPAKPSTTTTTTSTSNAVPPPALISALRQIFGSVSSPDLQVLLDKGGTLFANESNLNSKDAVNTLPSLLHAVLNHSVFEGNSSTPPETQTFTETDLNLGENRSGRKTPNVRRDWKSMFDLAHGEQKEDGTTEGDNSSVATSSSAGAGEEDEDLNRATIDNSELSSPGAAGAAKSNVVVPEREVRIPLAANLESIVGNACRDMLHDSGSPNGRVHGLLIAALSVMTGCLFSPEDLERLNLGEVVKDASVLPTLSTTATSTSTLDSTNETTDPFANLLQVGALLAVLPKTDEGDATSKGNFVLDEHLLQYLVNASSTYEERIEIQKANLFRSQTPPPPLVTPKNRPVDKKPSSPSVSSLLGGLEDGGEEARTSDSSDDSATMPDIGAAVSAESMASSLPDLISRASRSRSVESGPSVGDSSNDGETEASRLLRNIVNIVADEMDDEDEIDNLGEDDDDDDHSEDEELEENESTSENEDMEDDEEEDDEEAELQRALALSLAAAIGAESSDNSEDGSHRSDGDSDASDATTEAAAGGAPLKKKVGAAATTTPAPSGKAADETQKSETDMPKDNSTPLPPLPTHPPISLLPNHNRVDPSEMSEEVESDESAEGVKTNAEADLSAVFEPSALSSFGKIPASHVLVHLLHAVLRLMQGHVNVYESAKEKDIAPKKLISILKKKDSSDEITVDKEEEAKFAPDSVTASLLIASLQLSTHLRNTAMSTLTDLLSDVDGKKTMTDHDGSSVIAEVGSDSDEEGQSIQIANSAALDSADPLIEKEDPASIDFGVATAIATAESLETKGFKRKASAAAQVATLIHKNKLRLVEVWRGRVAFYSACCLLNLRCLRSFMGKSLQLSLSSPGMADATASGQEVSEQKAISISTKTRLGLLATLSNFYNAATSSSFQSLKVSMGNFFEEGNATSQGQRQDQFLVGTLCNESLHLWGLALPFLYPDHMVRVELLGSLLSSLPQTTSAEIVASRIMTCAWTDDALQRVKLDIFCKRLRVSDMLDCFVMSPMVSTEVADNGQAEERVTTEASQPSVRGVPDNSISTISLLSATAMSRSAMGSNLTKFYLALCQRALSNLILWNDLSMASNDANDHDISGGGEASGGGPGSAGGSSWADRGSLQLKVDPSKFHFDSSKCADSISVASSGSPAVIANQRATKVWGTVLSTLCFTPKSGIHRWAIKLDKCERGHVFLGVSTARANLKTYVGGDSNGWGLIGTQALWHDRNKIRGDYGSTFRTGAVVVVTLDTNVGTLSFGLWKESSPPEAAAAGPLSPLASPRRGSAPGAGAGGGPMIEDWGIAFEGIPLDVKLYPAIGLYQRDDRASLHTISNSMAATASGGKTSLPPISSGDIYFPLAKGDQLLRVRSWNQALCSDGVSFATETLSRSIQLLSTDAPLRDDVLLTEILPSLASSICLIPSCLPTLSAKYAMELLPLVTRCAKLLDRMIPSKDISLGIELKEGDWAICVDSSTSLEGDSSEEYVVRLNRKAVQGAQTGHSCYHGERSNASATSSLNNHFSVIGASCGTRVQFVEEWCSAGSGEDGTDISFEDCAQRSTASYVIDARVSLDGTKFEGIRHNVEKGSAERITGSLQQPHHTIIVGGISYEIMGDEEVDFTKQLIQTESLLCLAVGHLSLILCSQTSLSDIDKDAETPLVESLESTLSTSPILSKGSLDCGGSIVRRAIDSVWERCRSGKTSTDIEEQWQDLIYFDLFSATNASETKDAARIEETRSIIQQHISSARENQQGSLSRLCPDEYVTAQMLVTSAIFYHTHGTRNDAFQSEVTSSAWQASLGIMENAIRDALVCAESGVPHREVCRKRCFLVARIAKFLFEFSCTPDDQQPVQFIVDDISLIVKSIKSEQDLDYIKQQMNVRTEKSIMRYLGLRSLHLLLQSEDSLEGVKVHAAIESALVSLPRILCPSPTAATSSSGLEPNQDLTSHLTSNIAGCAASVQSCFHTCISRLYDTIGLILATTVDQEPTSLMLGLLANYFTVFHPSEYKEIISKMMPSLRNIVAHCRDQALLPNEDEKSSSETMLLNIVRKQGNERLLRTSASVLLTTCAQLTQLPCGSQHLVELLSEHLLQEISETISIVVDDNRLIRESEEFELLQLDVLQSYGSKAKSNSSHDKDADCRGLSYLSNHPTLSMKPKVLPSESPSMSYFGQLLNVFHVALNGKSFIESIKQRASALFSVFGLQLTEEDQGTSGSSTKDGLTPFNGLPLKFRRRILRLLRPILLSMEANSLIIRQLLHMAGSVAEVTCDTHGIHSQDELSLAQSALSLLRYLYTFSKPWRDIIHEEVISGSKDSSSLIFSGVLTFFGGAPGSLQPGAFVVIEPEVASSSSSAGATKSRNGSLTGAASNATNTSSGSGAEEIVTGLCRNNALSGVMSSVDPRTGSCEVIVLGNKSYVQLLPNTESDVCAGASRVTIRAVRVSAANISAADELPLFLDDTNLAAMDFFSPLSDVMESVSASIKAISNTQDKDLADLEIDINELMECCLGLRSTTVLASEPRVLHKLVADESSTLRVLLAHSLLMGSIRSNSIHSLSSLPILEARVWHLLSVRLALKSRTNKLDNTSPSSLKTLFQDKTKGSDVSPAKSVSKGYRTPPSAASGLFFGGSERASRNSSSREAAANNRQEEESASSAAAERNDEEGDDESSDTAAAHLREAAIVQMAELGLPRQWAELALSRVGGTNIEAAVHFCLERGGDMERLLAEDSERRGPSSFLSSRRRGFGASRMGSSNLIRQLVEMGFPRHWCVEALSATRNNVDEALTWILTNGDRLSAEDEAAEDDNEDEDEDEDEEDDENEDNEDEDEEESIAENNNMGVEDQPMADDRSEPTQQTSSENVGWSGICPVRFVSGRSNINPRTLEITGLPNGGFSSVGTKGVLLTSGKWYYEAEIKTAGCLQIGWADSSFVGHCQADRGDGCGDGPSSWAFDGWRRYRWHQSATEFGARWSEGDIVGCLVDMDSMIVSFTLNGKGEEIGMGVAFSGEGFRPCNGVYACVSFNRKEKMQLILGGEGTEPFKYPPPDGYRGIGEAIHDAVKERDSLLAGEKVLIETNSSSSDESSAGESKKYICDFSDGEHGHELFAWQHRYYGSDASVHLGSSRPSIFGGSGGNLKTSKINDVSSKSDNPAVADISSRLSNILSKESKPKATEDGSESFDSSINLLRDAYKKINDEVDNELKEVCASLCVLYSQKLVMHTMVSHSNQFSLHSFLPTSPVTPWSSEGAEQEVSRRLWQVVEHCTSLQSSGWVGEAGAMAVAAEALGLGISAGDNKSSSIPAGMCSVSADNDQVLLPCGGVTQFLTSAILPQVMADTDFTLTSTAVTFAACSENAIGSDVGGTLSFIRTSLQSAIASSASFRQVLLAAVRRAIRLLAVTEYQSDEGTTSEDDESDLEPKRSESDDQAGIAPDARLVSFLTGVLLSKPVSDRLADSENVAVRCGLFEAWCIGLLSASSPWRMVCAFTAAGILNTCPMALPYATSHIPIIARHLGGLESTVLRRTWAERAAVPVCSKYSQALMELLTSVKRALRLCPNTSLSSCIKVDAATPLPFTPSCNHAKSDIEASECKSWECSEGWVISNTGWEIWTGTVEVMEVEWKTPPRSIVRTLMDGGEGPPLLRENCIVMRGSDWDADHEDGKDLYEQDKHEKEEQKLAAEEEEEEERKAEEQESEELKESENVVAETDSVDPASEGEDALDPSTSNVKEEAVDPEEKDKKSDKPKKKKKKAVASKLALGTVLSIEPWNGVPAMARRVRWHLTGKEGIYRYGGDGGRFDLVHVETNEKETRVKKKHPPPESPEQCAHRYGFGKRRSCNVLLRLRNCPLRNNRTSDTDTYCDGILEWPDFGAGIRVLCTFYPDGAVSIEEKEVLYGSKDSGWEPRFGQSNFVPGTVMVISPTENPTDHDDSLSSYDELLGSNSFLVKNLRNKDDGGRLRVTSEMHLRRSKQSTADLKPSLTFSSSQPPPICFDPDFHATSISLSKDKRSVTCATSDGRGVAFGNVGFTKGVHYWEVKLEKAEIGSVYIGVAEKPSSPSGSSPGSSFGFESQPKLNRWLGWGFVNFRATYTAGAERVYGAHCHAGDTIGVLLDCDAGRINYFIDGVKYGEHILNDLGCAFENVSPFGFNADGCGSGGAGQGAPSGIDGGRSGRYPANGAVRPKALWPVIGLRHPGDRVTMSSKWISSHGVDGATVVKNALAVDEVLCIYEQPPPSITPKTSPDNRLSLPQWFIEESFHEYTRWKSGRWLRSTTRGSGPCKLSNYGLDVDLDTSPFACAAACASIGLSIAMLPGDKVDVKRSAGRILELQEEAVILGTYQGRLFYRLVSQKSEGGSLMEGGGRSWFWDESEAVDGGLQLIGEGLGHSVALPKLSRFNPLCGGLKVVYSGGAIVRSDLEIFDGSKSVGTIPSGTIIPPGEVIERRLNSCGVLRYLIDHKPTGRGWISSRIRGGKEEPIVELLPFSAVDDQNSSGQKQYDTPEDSAQEWHTNYMQAIESSKAISERNAFSESFNVESIQEFGELLASGTIDGLSELRSDSLVAATYGRITDVLPHSSEGGCSFVDCAIVLCTSQPREQALIKGIHSSIDAMVHEVANESLVHVTDKLPSTRALMARISMLRALNRRARYGLPWLPWRSAQEGSAILGGLSGFGTSLERAGRTWDSKSKSLWVQAPSISSRLRNCREIMFTSTKKFFLDSVMDATTSPTPLSHDEYELPREVRTVRVNRLKARRAMALDETPLKKKHSVFSQLQREMRGWSGATLRRGFVAKGHGGQKRAFKVKLVGEGVNDYSGPYREVFTDAIQEVTDLNPSGNSSLGVLQPSANNQADVGDGRDLFVFASASNDPSAFNAPEKSKALLSSEERDLLNSFSSLAHKKNENFRELGEALSYLGKLVGTACRHGIPVDLPLPLGVVWKRLTEENIDVADIMKEIDVLAFKNAQNEDNQVMAFSSDQALATQRRLLNSFAEGMSSVLPVELLAMFTGEQLRDIVCGNPDIDVELLRRVVEYEGYDDSDRVVGFFWEVLREMTTSERKLFLQFVWARNRLPLKESDFDAPFKIQKDTKTVNGNGDYPLPSASTCFFSLSLPEYPEKEILKKKLLFAIENVTTMESDYVTNDVEVSEGWRGL